MTFKKAFLLIGLVLAFHGLGLIFDLYYFWDWYDVPLHAGGGFVMAALGLAIWERGQGTGRSWLAPLFLIGFVALISVLWELHEFVLDYISSGVFRQPGLQDTMADFFNDLGGGLLGIAIFYRK